jgi:RimJ/RimL family protein N-acetyltransferase
MNREIELTDGSVLLRPYRINDVARQYEAARESIAEVSVWLPWCYTDYSIEESQTWVEAQAEAWEKGTAYDFTITDPGNGLFLGGCGLNNIDPAGRMANLGYWARTSQTKRGVATAATRLLAQFGFKELGLLRVELVIAVGNKASQRVAEKAGATREGILKNRLVIRDKGHDAVMFSFIPEDVIVSS